MAESNKECVLEKDELKSNQDNLKAYLSLNYPQSCQIKVIENIGEHVAVIKFNPLFDKFHLKVTLQIKNDCNVAQSLIIVNSDKNDANEIRKDLDSILKRIVDECYDETIAREEILKTFCERALEHLEKVIPIEQKKSILNDRDDESKSKAKKKSNKSKKSPQSDENDSAVSKKASMKTSGDVVKRIQWDEKINKDFIVVGYLDRFVGIKECPFNLFDWGDIVDADLGALAIPEHRINYFKYKNEVVWDKNKRIDNVFGSTCQGQTTIHDVIDRLENVEFSIDATSADVKPNKQGRCAEKDKRDEISKHPNHFVSIRIQNKSLFDNLIMLRNKLSEQDESMDEYLLPIESYHMTLCTLRIDTPAEMENVREALISMRSVMNEENEINDSLSLNVKGVGKFYDNVLYAGCEKTKQLDALQQRLINVLERRGVNLAGNYYDFVPHVSILIAKQTSKKCIDHDKLDCYESFEFGEQIISELDLCRMCNINVCKTYPIEFTLKL